jgi:hypothetical protein
MMKAKNMLMLSNHGSHWTEMRVEWIFKPTHNAKYIPSMHVQRIVYGSHFVHTSSLNIWLVACCRHCTATTT